MLQSGDLPEEQKEKIQVVKKKASEMAAMISQLLTLSRTKGQQVNKEYLNLSELTLMCAEATQVAAVEKSIEIYTDVEPDIYGLADETLYIRLLDNLLTNAIYYGKEGGTIHIGLVKEGHEIIGYVEDNGIGIEAGDIPRIWERFYRSDISRTSGEHVGLGLSMVKWIVEAHGGEISVESEVGKGSIFRFHIPVQTSSL